MAFLKTNGFFPIKYAVLIFLAVDVLSDNCKISWMETGHEVAESKYDVHLSIANTTGNLNTYFPNTYYDITIKSKVKSLTFTHFHFTLWNQNKTMSPGILQILESSLSKFDNGPYCINRVVDGPVSLAKLSIKIGWQSPSANSGCIELRAAIKETDLRYHTANVTVCQDPRVVLDDPGTILRNCCACDEGKYELAFEGLWSRYTHPKDFPRRQWLAVFPTVIGASHSHNYEFWRPYENATNGLKKFAETGDTLELELELKSNFNSLFTLIKLRGTNFQNKTRQSYASLRVNKIKHVVSLVARIEPSPDWFIGVNSMELCQSDCSWVKKKILNLYAFDAGVRNGILYEDIDGLTEPNDIIQSLNMTWPLPRNGKESPFYDATNNTHDVRPFARIHLTRIRGSEKSCQQDTPTEFCFGPWSTWSECSVECGIGVQKRSRNATKSFQDNCDVKPDQLEESRPCEGIKPNCPKEVTEEDCVLTEWGEWSKCIKICGQEPIKRSRSFKWLDNQERCEEKFEKPILEEKIDCGNPPCPVDTFFCVEPRYNTWSDWSPCSATQGVGFKVRQRTIKEHLRRVFLEGQDSNVDYGYSGCLYEKDTCEVSGLPTEDNDPFNNKPEDPQVYVPAFLVPTTSTEKSIEKPDYCFLPPDPGFCDNGEHMNSLRYHFDAVLGKCTLFSYSGCNGNDNNFHDKRKCAETCIVHGRVIHCKMSEWSDWSRCRTCGDYSIRKRTIVESPENGGRACSPKLQERKPCKSVPSMRCRI